MFRLSEYRFLKELGETIGHNSPIDDYFAQELISPAPKLFKHFSFKTYRDSDTFLHDLKAYIGNNFQFDVAKEIMEQLLRIENNIFHREFYEYDDF